jgi:hypothetical protein
VGWSREHRHLPLGSLKYYEGYNKTEIEVVKMILWIVEDLFGVHSFPHSMVAATTLDTDHKVNKNGIA